MRYTSHDESMKAKAKSTNGEMMSLGFSGQPSVNQPSSDTTSDEELTAVLSRVLIQKANAIMKKLANELPDLTSHYIQKNRKPLLVALSAASVLGAGIYFFALKNERFLQKKFWS